jgi:uncharacterized integral membrane protein
MANPSEERPASPPGTAEQPMPGPPMAPGAAEPAMPEAPTPPGPADRSMPRPPASDAAGTGTPRPPATSLEYTEEQPRSEVEPATERPTAGIVPSADRPTGQDARREPIKVTPTRTSAMWLGVWAGVLMVILLIIFVAQNTASVQINFLWMSGQISLALAMLIAGVAGAIIAMAVAAARIIQLRRLVRRSR